MIRKVYKCPNCECVLGITTVRGLKQPTEECPECGADMVYRFSEEKDRSERISDLDEAIKHCHEKAAELRAKAKANKLDVVEVAECEECAEEHEQLAAWLEELKKLREARVLIDKRPTACFKCKHCCYSEIKSNGDVFIKCNLAAGRNCKKGAR